MIAALAALLRRLGIGAPKEPRLFERRFDPVDHPLRPILDERYAAMRAAIESGDRESMAALLAPHFTSVDVMGKESTGDQMIDSVLRLHIDYSKRIATTTLAAIEESSGVARVLQHYAMTATADAGPAIPSKLQTLSSDTWVDVAGNWLLAKTQTLEVESVSATGEHHYLKETASTDAPKRFPLLVTARMWEYIEPIARGDRYEDPLDAFLIRGRLGELDGGGTQMAERPIIKFVDVTFWLEDSDSALGRVAEQLSKLGAPVGSEMQYSRGGTPHVTPFGSTECVAIFLDGVSLPAEVYRNEDVNAVNAHVNDALGPLGSFRSHWRGPRETALFYYGTNAEDMKDAMMPVLAAEPLCQNAEVIVRYGRHPTGPTSFRLPLHDAT